MRHSLLAAALCAALLEPCAVQAGGLVEGPDLSDDWLAPTAVTLDLGTNLVQGTSGYSGGVLDRDFFSITVAPGTRLQALVLGGGTVAGGAFSFVGVQSGAALTVDPPTLVSGAALLGWHLYGSADIGSNILDDMGAGTDKVGFSGPLPAGSYTFWVQELAPAFPGEAYPPYPYQFDLQVAAVPEPASLLLMSLGGLLVAVRQARRRDVEPCPPA